MTLPTEAHHKACFEYTPQYVTHSPFWTAKYWVMRASFVAEIKIWNTRSTYQKPDIDEIPKMIRQPVTALQWLQSLAVLKRIHHQVFICFDISSRQGQKKEYESTFSS